MKKSKKADFLQAGVFASSGNAVAAFISE